MRQLFFLLNAQTECAFIFLIRISEPPDSGDSTSMSFKTKSLIWLFLLTGSHLVGSTPSYFKAPFVCYSVDQGLSQSSVYSLFQDRRGFVWAGTAQGLNRFDGYQFVQIRKNFSRFSSLQNFLSGPVHQNNNGDIYFSSRSGIIVFREKTGDVVSLVINGLSLEKSQCEIIGIDTASQILWFWNGYDEMVSYQLKNDSYTKFPVPENLKSKSLIKTRSALLDGNNIWFATPMGFAHFSTRTHQFRLFGENYFRLNKISFCNALLKSGNGNFWIATPNSVIEYNLKKGVIRTINVPARKGSDNWINVMVEDTSGKIWMGSYTDGLYRLDPANSKLEIYCRENNDFFISNGNQIRSLMIGKDQNLWIGTDGGGLMKLDLKPLRFYSYPRYRYPDQPLPGTFIKSFCERDDSTLFLGTYDKGLATFNLVNQAVDFTSWKNSEQNLAVGLKKDSDGFLWVGSLGEILVFNPKPLQLLRRFNLSSVAGSGKNVTVHDLIITPEQQLICATTNGIFYTNVKNGTASSFRQILPYENLYALYQANDGFIWTCCEYSDKVYRLKISRDQLVIADSLENMNMIRSFCQLENTVWMGSEEGLVRFDLKTRKLKTYTTENGLADNFIYGILADNSGDLWISTNSGLCRLNLATESFTNFNVSDGLQSNEFNTGAFLRRKDGSFLFGGVNGFNLFYPELINPNSNLPVPAISRWGIMDMLSPENQLSPAISSITLPYDSNSLYFEITANEFTNPHKNRYEYKLVGFDHDWVQSGGRRFFRYGNLPSGKYQLMARAYNNDGIAGPETQLMEIEILPPFWETTGFIFLMILAGVAVLGYPVWYLLTIRLRKRVALYKQQEAVQQERERISRDMHDDLGGELSRIALLSEIAKMNLKDESGLSKQLDKISGTAVELVENLSEIVWSLNPRNDSLNGLMEYIRNYGSAFFENSNICFQIDFVKPQSDIPVTSDVRRHIFLVVKEMMNNALKHSEARNFSVHAISYGNKLDMELTDDGKGLSGFSDSGNGLRNMQKRLKILGSELHIESESGKFTRFRFSVELK
ncbi:MAG: hypothetical protein GC181_00755 [Bacteroidetes bacterium]|nr:hypothetical protein [Bacteroidota bacterium]